MLALAESPYTEWTSFSKVRLPLVLNIRKMADVDGHLARAKPAKVLTILGCGMTDVEI